MYQQRQSSYVGDLRYRRDLSHLLESVKNGNLERVKVLLEQGIWNHMDGYDRAFHAAIETGNLEIVQLLMATGRANVNLSHNGFRPLGLACRRGRLSKC